MSEPLTPEGSGTTTVCPLEGVHEHTFRGPHQFTEWYADPPKWAVHAATLDAARAAAPLDVERLAAAIKNVTPWKNGGIPWAKAIAAEYARLTGDKP